MLFLLFSSMFVVGQAANPCSRLTVCAVNKCLDRSKMHNIVRSTPRDQLFGEVVEKFDLLCMVSKCSKQCQSCSSCRYALDQMSALAQGEKTSGLCPKLEGCVQNCIDTDAEKALSCVAKRCNVHCYDGDCKSCKTISKRMFTLICMQTKMTSMPSVNFQGTCPSLFNHMAQDYVARRRLLH